MRIDWHGIYPALSTPCDDSGALDEESLRNEVRWNIEKGAHGVIVSIMSGEFHKFSDAERMRTYEIVVDAANGEVPVLAGPSHSGTEVVVQLAQHAKNVGTDGIVVLPPYFNLQDRKASLCLYDHYATIASRGIRGSAPGAEPPHYGGQRPHPRQHPQLFDSRVL